MIGQTLLHYRIKEELGRGGMGVVYLAEDTRLGRLVAIKFLPQSVADDDDARRRFTIEARAAAALNHPNIATIHAIEEVDGQYFIVMENIEGEELERRISGRLPEIAAVLNIARQIALGLQAAHQKGIVHRDIKASNIMLTPAGQVKIMDFGLAKMSNAGLQTLQGTALGTIAYMSPEQTQGLPADSRSDIWSLGILIYEMLAGEKPFIHEFEQALIYSILNEEPPAIGERRSDLPQEMDAFFGRMLAKAPEQRYQSMDEVLEALARMDPTAAASALPPAAASGYIEEQQQIGPYKLLKRIGEGGMGEVFLAEQLEPVRRQVALKIIKPGMDSRKIIARFEAERQALAVMDHPHIARVYEAGSTGKGRPYFVMEYVSGSTITSWCDSNQVSVNQRLELFIAVCTAVQHAHQKGIIHRDLKPSNILVAQQDGKPAVKIIDFGIAKAIHTPLTENTLITAAGEVIGTPAYMSPEQLQSGQVDIDTRSDIYALGVVLYELLTGHLPLENSDYQRPSGSLQKLLRDTDPPTPSKRLQNTGSAAEKIARNRLTSPGALHRKLAGDLDWITLKTLDGDRSRRYETANGLAREIRRYLNNEPVEARPPGRGYRLGKFVQRNKLAVFAGGIALSGLLLGLIFATVGLVRATRAERQSRVEAETAKQVSEFLVKLFEVSDPTQAIGDTISARTLLDRSAERIADELQDEPEIKARLQYTMGKVYVELGLHKKGYALLDSARVQQQRLFPGGHPELAATLHDIGQTQYYLGEFGPARNYLQQALPLFREYGMHREIVQNLTQQANILEEGDSLEAAEKLLEEAVGYAVKHIGKDNMTYAEAASKYGFILAYRGKYQPAEPLIQEALSIAESKVGPLHWQTGRIKIDLAYWYFDLSRYEEAARYFSEALEVAKKVYGPEHSETAIAMSSMATTYTALQRHDESIALHRQAVAVFKKLYGEEHYDVATAMNNYGRSLLKKGDYKEAEQVLREVLAMYFKLIGKESPRQAATYTNLGRAMLGQRNYPLAEQYLQKGTALFREMLGDSHVVVTYPQFELARLKMATGDLAAAENLLQHMLGIREKALEPDNPELREVTDLYQQLLRRQNRPAEADSLAARFKPANP